MSKEKVKSVHLQDFPNVSEIKFKKELVSEMDKVRDICSIALAIRDKKNLRVRLPLNSLKIIGRDINSLQKYSDIIKDEVNVKKVEFNEEIGDLATFNLQLDFKKLGSKLGAKMQDVLKSVRDGNWKKMEDGSVNIAGVVLSSNEYEIKLSPKDKESTFPISSHDAIVVLDTNVTEELSLEGAARDLVRIIQQYRRESGLNVSDKINIRIYSEYSKLPIILEKYSDYIKEQTLGSSIELVENSNVESTFSFGGEFYDESLVLGITVAI